MHIQRPRSVREVFAYSLVLYRRRIGFLLGAAVCILLPYLIFTAYVRTHFLAASEQDMQQFMTTVENDGNASASQLFSSLPHGSELWLGVLIIVYVFIAMPLLMGVIAHMTALWETREQEVKLHEAGNLSFHRLWANITTIFLIAVIYIVVSSVYMLLVSLVTSVLAGVSGILGAIVGVLGTIAFVIGMVWYIIRSAFTPIIVVEENLSLVRAIRRSFELTRYQTRRLLGFFIMLLIVVFVVETFMSLIGDLIFYTPGGALMVSTVVSIVVTPFAYVVISMMYLDLRIRKEK
ncbi:hypothetical protein [Alicyclobacillus dauci]|uniref:DUF7847 domain-containing protein n=1 Tax=Alicyclobacillus dauci TaxID=1475485 RepID=A0ABY6Z5F2_9BACL|nr:hypothetical protein [Alicyclobacillus dauci]WAH38112.1 hypothetical protein NZD86_06385 [Alicyclobacillus dauci]